MIFNQFYLPCLAHASYMIGDEATGTAAVVDPQRDTDQYIQFASEHALKIKHVFLTHLHADFVAGHLELRERQSISAPWLKQPTHLLLFAMATASLLQRDGFDSVSEIAGGIAAWEAAKLPVRSTQA